MVQYYELETSPRKLEPRYNTRTRKPARANAAIRTATRPVVRPMTRPTQRPVVKRNVRQNTKHQVAVHNKNVKLIAYVFVGFIVLLGISYRYALINSSFMEKEKLKAQLSELQKQNEQIQVNIEKNMNLSNVEQAAKEKLGMKKLDNSQKVYVSLDKEDYIETSIGKKTNESTDSWWNKLIKTINGGE